MTDELDSSFFNRMSSNIDNEIVSLTKFYNKTDLNFAMNPFPFCVDMTNLFDGKSRMFQTSVIQMLLLPYSSLQYILLFPHNDLT